jgi:glycosyltransferase involved in cell wall biosynthesis
MLRRLRILDVAPIPICPPGGGSSTRIYHLLRGLSVNHEIRLFSQVRGLGGRSIAAEVQESETFHEHRDRNLLGAAAAELCARSWIRPQSILSSASMRVTRPRLLREWLGWADIALIEFPWQFAYCRLAAPELPMVFMSHNVEVLTRTSNAGAAGVNARRSPVLALVRRQERFALARADLVICVSEPDRAYFVERFAVDPARAAVIPSGADTDRVRPVGEDERQELRRTLGLPDARTVVFMSGAAKVPDVEGLKWVRRVAARRSELTFLVVGGISAVPYREGNVIATGKVPDVCPYLQASDVALAPIEFGGGTKLKVFGSLAAGLPTIVFTETIRGTELADGRDVLVAGKSVDALDGALDAVLDDPVRAGELARAAREFVVQHHDWKAICERLDATLTRFAADAGVAGVDVAAAGIEVAGA